MFFIKSLLKNFNFWQVFITKFSVKSWYRDPGKTPNPGSYRDCHQDPGRILACLLNYLKTKINEVIMFFASRRGVHDCSDHDVKNMA